MAVILSKRKNIYVNVVKQIHVQIKQDMEGYYWGKVYDSGTLVYHGSPMQSLEKAENDVTLWVSKNYKVTRLKPIEREATTF